MMLTSLREDLNFNPYYLKKYMNNTTILEKNLKKNSVQ